MATRLEVIAGGGLDREGVSFFIVFSRRMKKEWKEVREEVQGMGLLL